MTKTIPVIVLAFTLILSTITLGNTASGFVYQKITWIYTDELATCETFLGETCGSGNLSSRFNLLVQNQGGFSTGQGEAILLYERLVGPLTSTALNLQSKDLQFSYNRVNKLLTITGFVVDEAGDSWDFLGMVENIQKNSDGTIATGDLYLKLESQASKTKIKQTILGLEIHFTSTYD